MRVGGIAICEGLVPVHISRTNSMCRKGFSGRLAISVSGCLLGEEATGSPLIARSPLVNAQAPADREKDNEGGNRK